MMAQLTQAVKGMKKRKPSVERVESLTVCVDTGPDHGRTAF